MSGVPRKSARRRGRRASAPRRAELLAYSVREVSGLCSVGRTILYQEIKAGRLASAVVGRRRIVLRDDLVAWLRARRRGDG